MDDSFFCLRRIPGDSSPPFMRGLTGVVWRAYQMLEKTQWWNRDLIEKEQLVHVRRLLSHAAANVPYYGQLLAARNIDPRALRTMEDYRKIPLQDRHTYRNNLSSMQARCLPDGVCHIGSQKTSGSSGIPVEVLQTNVVSLWWLALWLRDMRWCNVNPRGSYAAIRYTGRTGERLERLLQGALLPHRERTISELIETGPTFLMDIGQDPRRQLDWLRQIKPDYLLSYPANLVFLAALIAEQGEPITGLRRVLSASETLTKEMQVSIESAFGVPVMNTYSCEEAGCLASPCPEGHGLHVHSENVFLEVLDSEDRPCGPGQTGRVVITTLQNSLMPFIRYELMDEAEVGPDHCPCGRGLPLLTRVLGKQRPLLHLPDGRRKSPTPLCAALTGVGGAYRYQLVQRATDHILIRLVPDLSWTGAHEQRMMQAVRNFFERSIRVEIERLDRFDLPGSGKFQTVVVEIEQTTH